MNLKEKLKKNFEDSCEAYVKAMLNNFEIDRSSCFWVADEIGGVLIVGDVLSLDMMDIIYIVNNDVPYEECLEWTDYNCSATEFNFNLLNLESWHMGAPRVPQETFEKLRGMKKEMEQLCDETRKKF